MHTIAVIDDDVFIGDLLERVLSEAGYAVWRAYSGTEALLMLEQKRPDLVLLDLMLPGLSGEAVLAKIRDLPVIVVSAKINVSDKVRVLLDGACDYVTKPFDTQELLARIAVQLRTAAGSPGAQSAGTDAPQACLSYEDLVLDETAHGVLVQEQPVRLTKTEFAILKLLMQNPAQVITKSVMLDRISADTPDCMESSLKVHVSNLRKKLRDISGRDYIEAVWGIGFKLRGGGR